MYEFIFLFVLASLYLIFASIQDLKTREVANWLSFSLIIFGVIYRISYGVFSGYYFFIYQGIIGMIIFIVLGYLFYYGRFFAGGDAKLLMGLGAAIFFYPSFYENLISTASFLFLMLVSGAVYGIFWSTFLMIKNYSNFQKEFKKLKKENWGKIQLSLVLSIFSLIFLYLTNDLILLFVPILIFILPWIYIYAKAIDEGCMIYETPVEKLVEGDWLYKQVVIDQKGKNKILPNWQGLDTKEIEILKKSKIKSVEVKQGIPFVPAISLAFFIWMYLVLSESLGYLFLIFGI